MLTLLKNNIVLFFYALLPGLILLFGVSPFFNSVDTICMYSWSLASHVPHWQPGYLFFIRCINSILHGNLDINSSNYLLGVSVYITLCIQHIISSAALVFFVKCISNKKWIQYLNITIVNFLSPYVFAANMISLEGLQGAIFCLIFGLTFVITKENKNKNNLILFLFTAFLASLFLRHESILLIIFFLTFYLLQCWHDKKNLHHSFFVCIILMLAVGVNKTVNGTIKYFSDNTIEDISGRAGIYFLYYFDYYKSEKLKQHLNTDIGRKKIAKNMKAGTESEILQAMIDPNLNSKHAWTGNYSETKKVLQKFRPEISDQELNSETDKFLKQIVILYIKTNKNLYFSQVVYIIKTYFLLAWQGLYSGYFGLTADFFQKSSQNDITKKVKFIFDFETKKREYIKLYQSPFFIQAGRVLSLLNWTILNVIIMLFIYLQKHTRQKAFYLSISLLVFLFVYLLAISFVTVFVPRYSSIAFIVSSLILVNNLTQLFSGLKGKI